VTATINQLFLKALLALTAMDWAHDNAYLSAASANASKLFKHVIQATVVVKIVRSNEVNYPL
jgi:hypothetical protein